MIFVSKSVEFAMESQSP
jgi:hypothetical protein